MYTVLMHIRWTQENILKLANLANKYSNPELAEILNTTPNSIACALSSNNIKRDACPNRKQLTYEINDSGCHVCTSHCKTKEGYTYYFYNGKLMKAHQYIYLINFGKIPKGLLIRHKCDNPSCINPNHLELGTIQDNISDRVNRGRQIKGSQVYSSKLTEEDVRQIKVELKNPFRGQNKELSDRYNVASGTISNIKSNKTWSHITLDIK